MTLLFELPPSPAAPVAGSTATFPIRRIFCVGRNYAEHAREMGMDPDRDPPFFFTKWAETYVPNGGQIPYPQASSNFHFEGELVVAIGATGRNLSPSEARSIIYGYAAGLDMTRRDLQLEARKTGRPWDTGKNVESSSPIGLIHPVSEIGNLETGRIALSVNDEVRQEADLADLIWSVDELVSFLSSLYRLEPGDIIYTGTPAGVGAVDIGDRIVVEIEGLKSLEVTIVGPAE